MVQHHDILIIGGGNAGISLAARLRRTSSAGLAIVEPSSEHYFQPLFSHIAAGVATMDEAVRPMESVMPEGVKWIKDRVVDLQPENDSVVLSNGTTVTYGHLVVCPGLQLDFDAVPGLVQAMDGTYGSSDYDPALVTTTWDLVRNLRSGTAVFTQPPGPAKCAGAAQKIAYMACDYWRAGGVLDDIEVHLVVASPTVFGMPDVDAELNRKISEYGIVLHTGTIVESVDAATRTVQLGASNSGDRDSAAQNGAGSNGAAQNSTVSLGYDFLHAVPPQSAPD